MDFLTIGAISSMAATISVHPIDNFHSLISKLPSAALRGAAISGGYVIVHQYYQNHNQNNNKKIPFWCAHLAASTTASTGFVLSNYFYERIFINPTPRIQWSQIPMVMIFLTSYGCMRHYMVGNNGDSLQYFAIGGMSGLVATSVYYPITQYQYWRGKIKDWEIKNNSKYCLKYMWFNKFLYRGASWQFYISFWRSGILFTMLEFLLKRRNALCNLKNI